MEFQSCNMETGIKLKYYEFFSCDEVKAFLFLICNFYIQFFELVHAQNHWTWLP